VRSALLKESAPERRGLFSGALLLSRKVGAGCAASRPNAFTITDMVKFDPQKHHRRSIRLPHYDYCVGGFVPPHAMPLA